MARMNADELKGNNGLENPFPRSNSARDEIPVPTLRSRVQSPRSYERSSGGDSDSDGRGTLFSPAILR